MGIPMDRRRRKLKYAKALEALLGRPLVRGDGLGPKQIESSEKRLKIKLPEALKEYYELAGDLPLNKEHNRLYLPKELTVRDGWLIFMEENQAVVFWGMKTSDLGSSDPKVYQASNEPELRWYSERRKLSDFVLKMWRWQRGI